MSMFAACDELKLATKIQTRHQLLYLLPQLPACDAGGSSSTAATTSFSHHVGMGACVWSIGAVTNVGIDNHIVRLISSAEYL